MRNRSTETVLLSVYNSIITAMSSQQVTAVCMLDLSSTFDTIDHSILLNRLSTWFGIEGCALNWFSSFLSNLNFRVKILDDLSSPVSSHYGVPQGSILGPILFSLYTTPLSQIISSNSVNHHLFADDTQLFTCFTPNNFSTAVSSITLTFEQISSWMSANFLALNATKTIFILFGTQQQLSKLDLPSLKLSDGTVIIPSTSVRNLGVILDSNLNFHEHITKLSQSCFFHIRDLRRIRPYLNRDTAATVGAALVHSKLDYCNSLL